MPGTLRPRLLNTHGKIRGNGLEPLRVLRTNKGRLLAAVTVAVLVAAALLAWGFVAFDSAGGDVGHASVAHAAEIVPLPHRQLLVTDFGSLDRRGAQVLITDFHDRLIWKYRGRLVNPHSAYQMANGDILISDTGDNRVIEVNRQSRIVWDTDDLGGGHGKLGQGRLSDGSHLDYPNDAKPLPHGRVLISCRLQNRVIEITRQGRIVRDVTGILHRQHNPDLLRNGDMLIADSEVNRVIQVNRANRITWRFGGPKDNVLAWPRDANLLPNGNILITDSDHNRLVEVTRSRRIVRYWTDLQRPYAAVSLRNGNILVGDGPAPGIVELNQQDHIVWSLNRKRKAYLKGVPSHLVNGGFEYVVPGTRNIPLGWQRDDGLAYSLKPRQRATIVRDGHVHHGGRYSGRITYQGDSNGIYFSQPVRVVPGGSYHFSGWIKTRNVRPCHPCVYGPGQQPGHTAEYEFGLDAGKGAYPPAPSLPSYSGTTSWTHDSLTFTIPGQVHVLEIDGYLRGRGTVWFDDVRLKRVG